MRELSLFSGAGGGLLGTKLLGWSAVGYVEFNDYCQRVLTQRIKDGYLEKAPIFSDIRAFISEGYAESYKGMVDVITAGFPCQPFSVAGKGLGVDDPRNMWPATRDCLDIIRPRNALLENVPGLLTHGYIRRIFGDLAEMGYDCRWGIIGADDAGAPHRRKRLWIVANSSSKGLQRHSEQQPDRDKSRRNNQRQDGQITNGSISWWDIDPADLPDTDSSRKEPSGDDRRMGGQRKHHEDTGEHERENWCFESGLGLLASKLAHRLVQTGTAFQDQIPRVACNVKDRVNQLKALGNGQVPATVAKAWEILSER